MVRSVLFTLFFFCVAGAAAAQENLHNAYQFQFQTLDGKTMPLADYQGKLLLVVNTASQSKLTSQYQGLEALYRKYHDRGLMIIGVPSNDFENQEPGSAQEIQEFTQKNFMLTFPLTEKMHVTGRQAHPFYLWVGQKAGFSGVPKWNFHKILIGADGEYVDSFPSATDPLADNLVQAVEANLPR